MVVTHNSKDEAEVRISVRPAAPLRGFPDSVTTTTTTTKTTTMTTTTTMPLFLQCRQTLSSSALLSLTSSVPARETPSKITAVNLGQHNNQLLRDSIVSGQL
eukprot:2009179-Amphidinium_carterae.1